MDTQKQQREYWLNFIIDRLTKSISAESDLRLQQWIQMSDENALYYKRMEQLWDAMDIVNEEEHYNSTHAFLFFKQRVQRESADNKRKSFTLKKVMSYVAILISFIVFNYFTFQYWNFSYGKHDIHRVSEIEVPYGSKTKLTLQDGTKIWLNAGSKIQYDSDFGKKNRSLKLFGEAYLEVAKDKRYPFIVDVGEVKVKVLGTCFNVRAYKDNREIEVALLEGAVEMETDNGEILNLLPEDIAKFNVQTKDVDISHNVTSSQNSIGWIENRLIFNGKSFEQITKILERTFKVKINIHRESMKEHCFIGDFVNDETIEQIFKIMSFNEKFTYAIKGNVIDVY